MTVPMILASGSPIRAKMLQDAGLTFDVEPARIDEDMVRDSLLADGARPRAVADALAELKALKVSQKLPAARVIGSDQVLADPDGQLLSKPSDKAEAAEQLKSLSGRTHVLISAVVVAEAGKPVWRHVAEARMHMRTLTDAAIEVYLDRAWPAVSGCVGCYQFEAQGSVLFRDVDGDFHTILGMPLIPLLSYLELQGNLWP